MDIKDMENFYILGLCFVVICEKQLLALKYYSFYQLSPAYHLKLFIQETLRAPISSLM